MKICSKCKQSKPLTDFHRTSNSPSGRTGYCKPCTSEYNKSRYVPLKPQLVKTTTHKECRTCHEMLPLASYTSKRIDCKACVSSFGRLDKYGITHDQFAAMSSAQSGRCAICGVVSKLYVDHDHSCCAGTRTCGECIRGLLCMKCNSALGLFGDDPTNLRAALAYLD